MSQRKPLIAGNWKMFGLAADLAELTQLDSDVSALTGAIDVIVCPPATLIAQAKWTLRNSPIQLGGQDCHAAQNGAHTGDVSAAMLADAGARWVILGHSERRRDHGESDALVRQKIAAARAAGLAPIVCVGESIEQRKAGAAEPIVAEQLAGSLPDAPSPGLVVAYEPVWAIGTGVTPTAAEIAAMHAFVRGQLDTRYGAAGAQFRVLYGGSVKPQNARDIFVTPNVDGALVGGASLKAADFTAIIRAHPAAAGR